MKILFIPVGVTSGLVAGFVGKKVFDQVWGLFDDEEPPKSKHRDPSIAKVMAAAAVEGAIFAGTRAAIDKKARHMFEGATGTWPGEKERDPA